MFETVSTAPPDAILGISEAFNKDNHPNKINLSVGVYKDADGRTPVLQCVKQAERRLLESETSKTYLGIDGLPQYCQHIGKLLFSGTIPDDRTATIQTPGGTGGLRLTAEFIADQMAGSKIWISNPTWANHRAVFESAGIATKTYRYLDDNRTSLDFAGMTTDLTSGAARGDVVLLHACCHNPTGVDFSESQWLQLADDLSSKGLIPLIDFAYQGFGQGLQKDASGVQAIFDQCDEGFVVNSFSKNFGLYSERVGALTLVTANTDAAAASLSQLKRLVRTIYSNPPRHGAAIVATVLDDPELTAVWNRELASMRERIAEMRKKFVEGIHRLQSKRDFSFLLKQNGMFSFSGLNPMQVDQLRTQHSVYIVGSGRISVAGITESNLEPLCKAIAAVL